MSEPNDCVDRLVSGDHGPGCRCDVFGYAEESAGPGATRITVRIGGQPSAEAVAARPFFKQKATAPADEARVVEEWRVTGEPGQGYPSYRFTFSSDRYPDPRASALKFIELHTAVTGAAPWDDGPHLAHRTVTYSEWEAAS